MIIFQGTKLSSLTCKFIWLNSTKSSEDLYLGGRTYLFTDAEVVEQIIHFYFSSEEI